MILLRDAHARALYEPWPVMDVVHVPRGVVRIMQGIEQREAEKARAAAAQA